MSVCCPSCSSSSVIGTEVASVCTECVSVSAAGMSVSLPILCALTAGVAAVVLARHVIGRLFARADRRVVA
ncbi:MAG: hypothetical protein JJ974_11460 [Phycisphaerales bacterium]|nr:hypothetical protein [Phycisphaerales bacterium]